jgi:glycosyltransferase involved in cell wall biosynthesis
MPKVSVIIPTYNCAHYLGNAIASVLRQTFTDYEIIVVDDGSMDNTYEVVERFAAQFPSRIRYIYQSHKERSVARNRGIQAASGEYIAFLDADDEWLPHKLALQVPILDERPEVGLVHSKVVFMDKDGREIGPPPPRETPNGFVLKELLCGNFVWCLTVLCRRRCFDECGWFDTATIPAEDWDMWVRIAARYALYHIPEVLARYRFTPDPEGARDLRHYRADLRVVEKNASLLPPRERAVVYFVWGRKAKMRRDFKTARRLLAKSLVLDPTNLRALNLLLRCYISRQVFLATLERQRR